VRGLSRPRPSGWGSSLMLATATAVPTETAGGRPVASFPVASRKRKSVLQVNLFKPTTPLDRACRFDPNNSPLHAAQTHRSEVLGLGVVVRKTTVSGARAPARRRRWRPQRPPPLPPTAERGIGQERALDGPYGGVGFATDGATPPPDRLRSSSTRAPWASRARSRTRSDTS
jgi:hypothetical protein